MLCLPLIFGHCWREVPGLDRPLVWPSLAVEHGCVFCATSSILDIQMYTLKIHLTSGKLNKLKVSNKFSMFTKLLFLKLQVIFPNNLKLSDMNESHISMSFSVLLGKSDL